MNKNKTNLFDFYVLPIYVLNLNTQSVTGNYATEKKPPTLSPPVGKRPSAIKSPGNLPPDKNPRHIKPPLKSHPELCLKGKATCKQKAPRHILIYIYSR